MEVIIWVVVHDKVVLIFTVRRARSRQASQNGCRRRSAESWPPGIYALAARSNPHQLYMNAAIAHVYSPWDNNLLRCAVFDIRSRTGLDSRDD